MKLHFNGICVILRRRHKMQLTGYSVSTLNSDHKHAIAEFVDAVGIAQYAIYFDGEFRNAINVDHVSFMFLLERHSVAYPDVVFIAKAVENCDPDRMHIWYVANGHRQRAHFELTMSAFVPLDVV